MPAILNPEDEERWLDPAANDDAVLAEMLRPFAGEAMELFRVSPFVNSASAEGPACIHPLPDLFTAVGGT